jgi:hypothetical protein
MAAQTPLLLEKNAIVIMDSYRPFHFYFHLSYQTYELIYHPSIAPKHQFNKFASPIVDHNYGLSLFVYTT